IATEYGSLEVRLRQLDAQLVRGDFTPAAAHWEPALDRGREEPEPPPEELEKALTEDMQQIAGKWNSILQKLPQLLRVVLIAAKPSPGADNQLLLVFQHEIDKQLVDSGTHPEEIRRAVEAAIGKSVEIRTVLDGDVTADGRRYPDLTKLIKKIPIEFVDE
ncbi:MAG: DNA polymerase III subunit gamma/tau, partial [Lachnospiraceae bacterium]|nr:DNA polymerase III subunit gamma/tau [Lachnospiraceae bacterium]